MAEQEYTPTEADEFERRAQKQRTKLGHPFPWILRIRQRFVDAGGSPRAFDHCVESYAATAVERALADQREKRPDRDQMIDLVNAAYRRAWHSPGSQVPPLTAVADAMLSSLALEPEAREEPKRFSGFADVVMWALECVWAEGIDDGVPFRYCGKHDEVGGIGEYVCPEAARVAQAIDVALKAREVTDAEVEAAAQAIINVDYPGIGWYTLSESAKNRRREQGRAALEAAREVSRG